MANRLADETSPYLLQHAENPVDWYPWGPEALERARRENKPILLSIGYAACHWCHVMAHESFENPQIAARMNELFVNIKVDREERPDLDSIYMQAVQAMTGHGGWPMTVFLTPDGVPYYGGTYYPPTDRHGMPGFPRVLEALSAAYREQPDAIAATGAQLQELFRAAGHSIGEHRRIDANLLQHASLALAARFDRTHAGFGGAPKFPPSMALEFLLTRWARAGESSALEMAQQTFRAMARGGIYDQVGGGLHRYSVDERWLVPHFEKMLYDNALFLRLGVHLWQATRDDEVRRVCEETAAWVLREMTSPEGGFFSSLDADSEGHEGLFYVWTDSELDDLLGADAAVAKAAWGVVPGGNFEGRNILHRPEPLGDIARRSGVSEDAAKSLLERARAQLFLARSNRVWPSCDDKVIASWNGLMLRALAEFARVLDDDAARRAAVASGEFILAHLVRDGQVLRSWRQGKVLELGFLEDQAAVGLALLELYTLTADVRWMHAARDIAARTTERFYDARLERFFDTASDHEALVMRPREVADNALPSGTSLVAELLLRLGILDASEEWTALGEHVLAEVGDGLAQHAQAFGHLATVADMTVHGAVEVVIVGADGHKARRDLERSAAEVFLPSSIVLALSDQQADETALGRGRRSIAGHPMGYVCRGYVCDAPTGDPRVLALQLRQALRSQGAGLA